MSFHTFDEWFKKANEYCIENGNLNIKSSYITNDGWRLGQWISKQRSYFKVNNRISLSQEQIHRLNSISMIWDPLYDKWIETFQYANEYYQANGNLDVPEGYRCKNGTQLRCWICNQRAKYFGRGDGFLNEEQISQLESIGIRWIPFDEQWDYMYSLAEEYFTKHQNLDIKERYIAENGQKLGLWLSRQRKRYALNDSNLSNEQIERLNKIHNVWDPFANQWNTMYGYAKEYYENIGDLLVPVTYVTKSGSKIGNWIAAQRQIHKRGKQSIDHILKLEAISMVWKVDSSPTQTSFAEQLVYYCIRKYFPTCISRYQELGFEIDVYIPEYKVAIEYDGATWHRSKNKDIQKNKKCKQLGIVLYRIRELDCPELNDSSFDYVLSTNTYEQVVEICCQILVRLQKQFSLNYSVDIELHTELPEIRKLYNNTINASWNDKFVEAKKYYEAHGDLRVPWNYITESGFNLRTWINNLRNSYQATGNVGIGQDRVDKLNSIGMIWSIYETDWEHGFFEAENFYRQYRHLVVPINYSTIDEFKLGIWIRSQRKNAGDGDGTSLTDKQIERLNSIGMVWDVFDEQWTAMFSIAKKYYDMHHNLLVPANYIIDGKHSLGNWVATQRARYKKASYKSLSDKQIQMLESIGMVWDVFLASWENGLIHAKEYYKENSNLLVPYHYRCEDNFPLGSWIMVKRNAYNGHGEWAQLTDSQIRELENTGMIWNILKYQWDSNYKYALAYFSKHGNLDIPKRYISEDGTKVGLWVQRQRMVKHGTIQGTLTDEQIKLLDAINMKW